MRNNDLQAVAVYDTWLGFRTFIEKNTALQPGGLQISQSSLTAPSLRRSRRGFGLARYGCRSRLGCPCAGASACFLLVTKLFFGKSQPERLELHTNAWQIVFGQQVPEQVVKFLHLYISLGHCILQVGAGCKWQHTHALVEHVKQLGGDHIQRRPIAPARPIHKVDVNTYYVMLLSVIAYF